MTDVATDTDSATESASMFALDGRVTVVTGAARGIGLVAAGTLARHGARVVMLDVLEEELRDAAVRILESGGTAVPVVGSVTEEQDLRRLADVVADTGPVSVVVNAAGVMRRTDVQELTTKDLEWLWRVNVTGTVAVTQRFLPQMIEAGYGKVVNVGSLGSLLGLERRTAYATTKGAVAQYTRSFASEVGRYGIRANVIAPGYVDTAMARPYMWGDPQRTERLLGRIPLGYFATPEDLAGTFLFLCSQASDYVTGQVLAVDGGWTSH